MKTERREDLKEEIYHIRESDNSYINKNGEIFIEMKNGEFFKKKTYLTHGYEYCKIKIEGKMKSRRIHRLIAEMFIENPENLPIVGHKNNIKNDNRIENLYWTTISENTQKAFDDKLAKNDKGYEDSQSFPVFHCDKDWNIISDYGSITICAKALGISKSTVARQVKQGINAGVPHSNNRYCLQSDYDFIKEQYNKEKPDDIYAINKNGKIIGIYKTIVECAEKNGVSKSTVSSHLKTPLEKEIRSKGPRYCYVKNYKLVL